MGSCGLTETVMPNRAPNDVFIPDQTKVSDKVLDSRLVANGMSAVPWLIFLGRISR
jgi:hypothetical protein